MVLPPCDEPAGLTSLVDAASAPRPAGGARAPRDRLWYPDRRACGRGRRSRLLLQPETAAPATADTTEGCPSSPLGTRKTRVSTASERWVHDL